MGAISITMLYIGVVYGGMLLYFVMQHAKVMAWLKHQTTKPVTIINVAPMVRRRTLKHTTRICCHAHMELNANGHAMPNSNGGDKSSELAIHTLDVASCDLEHRSCVSKESEERILPHLWLRMN
jgi:hypothetical protein